MKYNNLLEVIIDRLETLKIINWNDCGYSFYKSKDSNSSADCDMISLIKGQWSDEAIDVSRFTHDYSWAVERGSVEYLNYEQSRYSSEDILPGYVKTFLKQAGEDILGRQKTIDILEEEQTMKGYSLDTEEEPTSSPTEATPYTQEDLDEAKYTASEESYMEGYHVGRAEAFEEVCNKLLDKLCVQNT